MRFFILLVGIFSSLIAYAGDEQQFSTEFITGNFNRGAVEKALNKGINGKMIYSVQINSVTVGNYYFSREGEHLLFSESFYQEALSGLLTEEMRDELHKAGYLDFHSAKYSVSEDKDASTLSVWFHDTDLIRAQSQAGQPLAEPLNGLMVNYNMSPNYFLNRNDHTSDTALPLNSHIRLAMDSFPVDVDVSSSDVINANIDVDNFSISHLLPAVQSEISAGETYTNSRYAEGFNFYGVRIYSVDDLRSRHERYYTPNITGYARTNSTVEVYQGKRMLFTKTVAAGHFVIDEIQGLSNQTLRVVVKGADGTQNTFYYENTVVPGLLTPGTYSYELNGGRYRYSDNSSADTFISADYSHGFDGFTSSVNSIISADYKNLTLGGAFPLQSLGALGLSVSGSDFTERKKTLQGQSYSLNYAKYLNNGFNLQLAGYRYSSRHYLSFNDAMQARRTDVSRNGSLRNRFTATLISPVPWGGDQVALNMMHSNYWSGSPATDTYSLSYGGYASYFGYNLSVAKSYTQHFASNESISFSLNIPLGNQGKSVYTRYNYDRYSDATEVGFNSYHQSDSYSVAASRNMKNNDTSFSGAYNRENDRYSSQVSSTLSSQTAYVSGSVNGTLALADHHIILSNSQAQTLAVVEMSGVNKGSVNGVALQSDGYALVPLNDNFDSQDITADTGSLSNNILLAQNQISLRPRRGELTKVHFSGKKVIFIRALLLGSDGQPLAFGTELKRGDSGEVIFTGNGGGVLLQKAVSSQQQNKNVAITETDGVCHYTLSASLFRSNQNESNNFIDAGKLTCLKD